MKNLSIEQLKKLAADTFACYPSETVIWGTPNGLFFLDKQKNDAIQYCKRLGLEAPVAIEKEQPAKQAHIPEPAQVSGQVPVAEPAHASEQAPFAESAQATEQVPAAEKAKTAEKVTTTKSKKAKNTKAEK